MGALTLLITGATGFLGRACLAQALARGHHVRALSRCDGHDWPEGVEPVCADLAEGCPAALLAGVDVVVHTAGAMSNDPAALARDTIMATRALIAAAEACPRPPRVVLASSIAVYDARAGFKVTEQTPLEPDPARREPYVAAKLAQEVALCQSRLSCWRLRLGALYDSRRRWNAHIGLAFGPVLISLARRGALPLLHVQDAAAAVLRAAETAPSSHCEALNLIESAPPMRAEFIRAWGAGLHVPLHWRLLLPFAHLAEALLGARAPGLLRPQVLHARMAAHDYPNMRAMARLGWLPAHRFVRPPAQRSVP